MEEYSLIQSHLYTAFGQPGSTRTQYGDYCSIGQAQNKRNASCCDPVKPSWPNSLYRWFWSYLDIGDYPYLVAFCVSEVRTNLLGKHVPYVLKRLCAVTKITPIATSSVLEGEALLVLGCS